MALTKISTGMLKQDAASSDLNIDAGTLYLDVSNNRVGVANTSPSQALDVTGAIQTDTSFRAYDSVNTAYRNVLRYDGGNVRLETGTGSSASGIGMWTAGSERIRIDSSGNVLVGTTGHFNYSGGTTEITVGTTATGATAGGAVTFVSNNGATTLGYVGFQESEAQIGTMGSRPLVFTTNNTDRMRIDSSGRVGVGVTPKSWLTTVNVIDVGTSAAAYYSGGVTHNAYFDNTNNRWQYKGAAPATFYNIQGGTHIWSYAASGTADSPITFSEAMRIHSNGQVGIGVQNPTEALDVNNSIAVGLNIKGTGANTTLYNPSGDMFIRGGTSSNLNFGANNTNSLMILTSAGNLGIGTTPSSEKLEVAGNILIDTSGNPSMTVKTTGAGNNPFVRIQADTNYWDLQTIFSNTDDELDFRYNGVSKLIINKDGEVGIGTTSPSKKLHVQDSSAHQLQLQGNNSFWNIGTGWSGYYQDYLLFATSTGEKMVIDTNGNVGIGTNSPGVKLHISSSANTTAKITAGTNGSASLRLVNDAHEWDVNCQTTDTFAIYSHTDGVARLVILPTSGNVGIGTTSPASNLHIKTSVDNNVAQGLVIERSANSDRGYINYNGGGFQFRSTIGDPIVFGETDAEHMRILPDGNVGIGTTSPVTSLSFGEASTGITFLSTATNFNSGKVAGIRGEVGGTGYGNLAFDTFQGGNGGGERMMIRYDGNVGIGDTNPDEKLSVYGAVTSSYQATNFAAGPYRANMDIIHASKKVRIGSIQGSNTPTGSEGEVGIYVNSGEKVTINTSGNVGIGETSPDTRLEVKSSGTGENTGIRLTDINGTIRGNLYFGGAQNFVIHGASSPVGADAPALQFATGGTTPDVRMTILEEGNVGVGTSSPTYKMEVDGGAAETRLRISTTGTDADEAGIILANSSKTAFNDGIQIAHGAAITSFRGLTGTLHMAIDGSNSRVGIGTSSPQEKLQINGNLRMFSAGYPLIDIGITTSNYFRFLHDNPNDIFKIGKNGAATLNIAGSGNVGIGATSPDAPLAIHNSSLTTTTFDGTGGIRVHRPNAFGQYGWFEYGYNSDTTFIGSKYSGGTAASYGQIWFAQDSNGGSRQYPLVINGSGNVGIGATSPYFPLHVQGNNLANGDAKTTALFFDTSSAAAGTGGGIALGGYSNGTGGDIYHFGNIQGIKENNTAGNYASAMIFSTRENGATPTERMRIDSAGRVVVQDGVAYTANAPTTRGSLILAGASGSTSAGGLEFHTSSGGGAGYGTRIASSDANMFFLRRSNASGWTESMRIETDIIKLSPNGNERVRINNSNSTSNLSVGLHGVSGINASAAVHGSTGDAALVVTNTNLADSSSAYGWTGRGGRYLTSNGTNWTADGKDPGLVIGSVDSSTQRRNLGIVLHNEDQGDNTFSPGLFFGNRSNSGSYNTSYGYIMGRKKSTGVDANWSVGEIHMDTAGVRTGTISRTAYMDNLPAVKIDANGDVDMPYKAFAYGTITGSSISNITNNYGIALTTTRYQNCTPQTSASHGPGVTITKAGFYLLSMLALYDPNNNAYVYLGWCVNGSQIHHWHSNHAVASNHDAVSSLGVYLNIGDHVTFENSSQTVDTIFGQAHSAWYICKIG